MAATRDSTWIATKALTTLGEVSIDNPASPDDLALAIETLEAVQADLQGRNIVYIPDIDNTPAAVAMHIANALALELMGDYGYAEGQLKIPTQAEIDANLKLINSNGPQGFPMASLDY